MPYFDLVCRQCGHVVEDYKTGINQGVYLFCSECRKKNIVSKMVKLPSRIQTTYNKKGQLDK